MVLRDKVGADLVADLAGPVGAFLGKADPADGRVSRRHLAAKQAHAAASDDGEADALGVAISHSLPRRALELLDA
jgi:hypothetical protein